MCSIFHFGMHCTAQDGKSYKTQFYNLDAILSIGYRVNSVNATKFRKWATQIENLERKVYSLDMQVESLVQQALPPKQGIFFDVPVFDAYAFACERIRSAKQSIILIDNYVDELEKIIEICQQQVVLDCDVAVKNNPHKFPKGYILEP